MKVVICEGRGIPGVLDREVLTELWKKEMKQIPQVDEAVIRGRFDYEHIEEIAGDADALIGVWIPDNYYDDAFFERFPKLKYIATTAHGFGKLDRKAAARHGVTFTNTVYGDVTIAQFAMALLLDICHNVRFQSDRYRELVTEHQTVSHGQGVTGRQVELYGKTMGILGLGAIGLRTARMAEGFGMHVLAFSRHKKEGPQYAGIEQVSLDELYARSDIISVHCPSTDETRGMIGREAIAKMKDGVILINTARGDIIKEDALAEALNSGKVYAAGLDVVCGEPISERIPLMDCPNAVITPHSAWITPEARIRSVHLAAQNLKNWAEGHPTSVIS